MCIRDSPQSVRKRVGDIIAAVRAEEAGEDYAAADQDAGTGSSVDVSEMPVADLEALIQRLDQEMHEAAGDLRFEYAARLRDEIAELTRELKALRSAGIM